MCECTGITAFCVIKAGVGSSKNDTTGVGAVKACRRWSMFSINAWGDGKSRGL